MTLPMSSVSLCNRTLPQILTPSMVSSEHGSSFARLSFQRCIRSERQERQRLSDQEGELPVAQLDPLSPSAASPRSVEDFARMLWWS